MKWVAAIVLALSSLTVSAEEIQAAGFQNNMGGWTVIVSRTQYCGSLSMYDGYAFGGGQYIRFCWIKRNNAILALLDNNETRVWPIESFEMLATEPDTNLNKS
jgi:hypothetical protein